jgi:hypothetical protein
MDKTLLKAYIRTLVEEEVTRILPKMLSEAVQQVKQLTETATATNPSNAAPARKFSRTELADMMGLEYDGETLRATNTSPHEPLPGGDIGKIINRDYSALMKKMGLA